MIAEYYYLISSLPELNLQDKKLQYNEVQFRRELAEFLTAEDSLLIRALYYKYDIRNLIGVIKDNAEPLDERGNFDEEELRSGLLAPEALPGFMEDFIHSTKIKWDTATYHDLLNDLTARFIEWSQEIPNSFLSEWFEFEHNLRNILAGLNCRIFDRQADREVLGGHYEAEKILRSKDKDFGLSKVIDYVEKVTAYFQDEDIAVREMSFDQLRWNFIESLEEDHQFSIENLMAYILKIRLIERNIMTDHEEGKKQLNNILNQIKTGFELPEQFAK